MHSGAGMRPFAVLFVLLALVTVAIPSHAFAGGPHGAAVKATKSAASRPVPRRGPKYGAEMFHRAGLHLGRIAGGAKVTRPWAVAKLFGKTTATVAVVGAGIAGWIAAAVGLGDAGHPILSLTALTTLGVVTSNPFLPMPGSNLAIIGGVFAEGYIKGKASALRRTAVRD